MDNNKTIEARDISKGTKGTKGTKGIAKADVISNLSAEIDDLVMTLSTISADNTDEMIAELQRLDEVDQASGYAELSLASQWCQRNLALLSDVKAESAHPFIESGECWLWLELISAILADPAETEILAYLSTELLRDDWLEAYAEEGLQSLLSELSAGTSGTALDNSDPLQDFPELAEKPEYSSLSFTWDEEVHPEYLEAFLEETTDLVNELSVQLVAISKAEVDSQGRHQASRLAHTIKGGSAVAGITALSQFSYQLEQILEYSVDHKLADKTPPLLAESSACLEDLFKVAKAKLGEPKSFASVFNRLSAYAETLDEDDEPLTLGKPNLPDFITQQTTDEPINRQSESKSAEESIEDKIVLEAKQEQEQIEEVNDSAFELDDILMSLSIISAKDWDEYKQEFKHLASWAENSNYSEISKASDWCQQNFTRFAENKSDKAQAFIESGECWLWLEYISACLSEPEESSHLSALSTELMRDDWLKPFDMEDLQNLLMQLKGTANPDDENDNNEGSVDPSSIDLVESEGYQFSWDEDVHPELLASYLQETPDQISQVASLLIKISKGTANKADHQQASRIAHTIKGASGVVGISALVEFTHKLEDILDYSVKHSLPEDISSLLAYSSDCLEDTFDAILNKEAAPEEFAPLLSQLTEYSDTLEQDDPIDESLLETAPDLPDFITNEPSISDSVSVVESSEPSEPSEPSEATIEKSALSENNSESIPFVAPAVLNHQEPDFSALVSESGTVESTISAIQEAVQPEADTTIRVPIAIIDKLLNLVGELVTTSTQVADKIDKSIATSKQVKTQDLRVHKMLEELDTTLAKQEQDQFKMIANLQNSDFDHLEMDTYNELHSISGLLKESILDAEAIEANLGRQLYTLKDDLHTLDQLNNDLSDVILNSRMVSINSLIPRLERIVRQTSKKTKKRAELVVIGKEINVDTDILNGLTDPLLHLLRNAIDHGIEYPADRLTKEKDKTGVIQLTFSKQGNHILMQLKDDGAGIDAEKIYQKAIEKGLVAADQELSNNEKLQLILHAGFSTQENVTAISGRGVGMDVVNMAVNALNGSLDINSEMGKGSVFTIKIPLTLVTSPTLLVSVSGQQIAIPSESVEQLYYLSPENVIERKQGYYVRHEGNELPIQSLATLIGSPVTKPDFSRSNTLLFIKGLHDTHALYIDEILHSRQAVIKDLSNWLDTSKGLIGACHLPDGGVAPVINLSHLLILNEKTNQAIKQIQLDSGHDDAQETVARILVVDDSLSNRKALSLIIDQTDYEVMTAVDGLDALQVMNENTIDLVFTDLEMPRMNGIELTQAIRAWDVKKETPVVMITSRTTGKHRQLAEKAGVDDYLTKPVVTEVLLNSINQWLEKAVA